MTTTELLPVIQRKNPEREFEILKQIGSGTYGEVFKVCEEYVVILIAPDILGPPAMIQSSG